jgi:hypothetical protein
LNPPPMTSTSPLMAKLLNLASVMSDQTKRE